MPKRRPEATVGQLSKRERARLAELETVVKRGFDVFIEVGLALMEIKNSRLYRDMHSTFEEYLDQKWGLSRARGYQLIDAALVSTLVDAAGLPPPANERQARELVPVLRDEGEERMFAVLRELRDQHGESLTAEKIRQAVTERMRLDSSTRALVSSASNEWYTPTQIIEAAREVLGGIDLDPASGKEANETVRADRFYTEQDNGLAQEWSGRVWMNPPFGGMQVSFLSKLIEEYSAGHVTAAIALFNGYRFEARWFQPLWNYPLCFTNRRFSFYNPYRGSSAPPTGIVLAYLGPNPDAFIRVFSRFGNCVPNTSDKDETIFERGTLQEQWDLLALEERRILGTSEMPERDFVDEGMSWDRSRLDEEWDMLRLEEERILGSGV